MAMNKYTACTKRSCRCVYILYRIATRKAFGTSECLQQLHKINYLFCFFQYLRLCISWRFRSLSIREFRALAINIFETFRRFLL